MTRVLIKASSRLVEAGLESVLRSQAGLRLVRSSADGGSSGAPGPELDVLLAEAESLADAAARQALGWAAEGVAVVLLVRNPAGEPVAHALRAGIKAVLPSNLDGAEIATAIQAAAAGMVVLDPGSIENVFGAIPAASTPAGQPAEPLTPRELEVLRLLAAGLGNKEVAARLAISDHTVKFHVASIMGKLAAGSRTEAVTLGIRHGLIMV